MLQPKYQGKTSVIGIVIASICILVYLGALVSIIVRINSSMEQRRLVAEQEFYNLADLASSAGVLSFMDETFMGIIQKALVESRTLEGIIISGPNGEYGFEREAGKAIHWVNNSPRFRDRFELSRQSLYQPLRIQGLRNVNIQAVAGAFDYVEMTAILKLAMFLVASALALAFFTLFMESLVKKYKAPNSMPAAGGIHQGEGELKSGGPKSGSKSAVTDSYSQRGHITREENTEARLTKELRHCAPSGQDLTFMVMEFKPAADDDFYARFTADAARFFSSRDLVCEKGERGISVICPGFNLDTGFLNADEFHNRVMGKYPGIFKAKTDFCMGLSARSDRPINAERLMFEAEEALERAMMDPVSHIVAFKSDPEKYKAFMEGK